MIRSAPLFWVLEIIRILPNLYFLEMNLTLWCGDRTMINSQLYNKVRMVLDMTDLAILTDKKFACEEPYPFLMCLFQSIAIQLQYNPFLKWKRYLRPLNPYMSHATKTNHISSPSRLLTSQNQWPSGMSKCVVLHLALTQVTTDSLAKAHHAN